MSQNGSVNSAIVALSLFLTIALANCSGNSLSVPRSVTHQAKPGASSAPSHALGSLTVSVTIPKRGLTPKAIRYPKYVTAAVQSVVFTQTLSGNTTLSTPVTTLMTVGGANC